MNATLTSDQRVHKLEQMRGLAMSKTLIDGLIQTLEDDIKNEEEL